MWATLGTIWGICAGFGYVLDAWLLRRTHKRRAYQLALLAWRRLSRTKVPNIARKIALKSLRIFRPLIYRKRITEPITIPLYKDGAYYFIPHKKKIYIDRVVISWLPLVIASIISILLTIAAQAMGLTYSKYFQDLDYWEIFSFVLSLVIVHFEWVTITNLFVNLVFDILTVMVTQAVLLRILKSNDWMVLILIFIDLLIAILLGSMSNLLSEFVAAIENNSTVDVPGTLLTVPLGFLSFFSDAVVRRSGDVLNFLFAATALIPTAFFLLALFIAVLLRIVAMIGRAVALYLLHAPREHRGEPENLPIGTMACGFVGLVMSVVVAGQAALVELRVPIGQAAKFLAGG